MSELKNLRARCEVLEKYAEVIYPYVQGTGNTSPKTLGLHVAEALVMDHKELRAKCERLVGECEANLQMAKDANRECMKHWNAEDAWKAQAEALVEAVTYYSNPNNYDNGRLMSDMEIGTLLVGRVVDTEPPREMPAPMWGKFARKALEAFEQFKKELGK